MKKIIAIILMFLLIYSTNIGAEQTGYAAKRIILLLQRIDAKLETIVDIMETLER